MMVVDIVFPFLFSNAFALRNIFFWFPAYEFSSISISYLDKNAKARSLGDKHRRANRKRGCFSLMTVTGTESMGTDRLLEG